MRKKTAAALAVVCCVFGFALGRLSVFGGGAVMSGGHSPLALPALVSQPAPQTEQTLDFGPIDINTADQETLCLLPGIGQKTAEKIIAYRGENGPFASTEELMAVSGIGSLSYENIKEYICVGR